MTRARNQLICADTTPYYHCISRCVRRAFLCGEDSLTGKDYAHRKPWVVDRLGELAEVYAIDICAYAIMSNHYHLVLRIDRDKARQWTHTQVAEQWARLHQLPILITRYMRGETSSQAEDRQAETILETWRTRLTDISWFMRGLNEHLARRANQEDGCTGRYWEGRFKSQALLDAGAVLTCMSYVDLNPLRAGVAATPEDSDFTSIQQRLAAVTAQRASEQRPDPQTRIPLMPLKATSEEPHPNTLGYTLFDYLQLIDWAGRAVREDKPGAIAGELPPILQRLGLNPTRFIEHMQGRAATERPVMLGRVDQIRAVAQALGRRFIKGISEAHRRYRQPLPV